uniref:Si:ch73-352p4.8 n=1 Tax=Cyclopterus lumpus TaxID=8103 RepID=A0A8C3B1F8_CYCLU
MGWWGKRGGGAEGRRKTCRISFRERGGGGSLEGRSATDSMDGTPTGKGDDGKKEKTEDEAVQLRRTIGLLPAMCLIIGTVVGSGIFIAPKGVLANSGGSVGLSLLVWVLCGVLSLLGAMCYAELGTTFTKSGGHYIYLLETLGPLPAFLRLWIEGLFIRPAVSCTVALAFGRYVVEPFFTPCAAPIELIKLVTACLCVSAAFVVAINCWSVTLASRTQVALTFLKMFALVLIIVPGGIALAKGGRKSLFQNGFEVDSSTLDMLPLAFYNGLYAYGGWFYLNYITEEVRNPNRNLPLAIICSIVTVTVCYVLVNVAYFTAMTPAELLLSEAVAVVGVTCDLMSYYCLVFSGVCFKSDCLCCRMLLVGAREGHWPTIFSMIHIRRRTPLPYPLMVLMLVTGDIYQLINFVSFSRWLFIALATLGMILHRYRFPDYVRPFKVTVSFFCALTLSGIPVYYVTVYRYRLPRSLRRVFGESGQLQILLEVTQQEVQTY